MTRGTVQTSEILFSKPNSLLNNTGEDGQILNLSFQGLNILKDLRVFVETDQTYSKTNVGGLEKQVCRLIIKQVRFNVNQKNVIA